jgi:hypothetical protein
MIIDQAVRNQGNPDGGQELTNMNRRTLIGGGLAALLSSGRVIAQQGKPGPYDPFILLLSGVYHPVPPVLPSRNGPNLDLTTVDLTDGSYSRTEIYPVRVGIPDSTDQEKVIGNFYVQPNGYLCAYDLPGGAIAMRFNDPPIGAPPGFDVFVPVSDMQGGTYLLGTFELEVLEATGIYAAFQGGHNHMVDKLHILADGSADEFCFCNISTYKFP